MSLCRCGCGQRVGQGVSWRPGHNMRVQAPGAKVRAGKRVWAAAEDAKMRALFPDTKTEKVASVLGRSYSSVCQRARILRLKKSAAYLASPDACRLRRENHPGKAFQFPKGHVPANKGLRRPGWAPGRMRETQFKKGVRLGVAARVYKPIGTERISKDGYLERKVNEAMPFQRRWRAVHLIVWEAEHGPLPKGHAIAFKNRDKRDIRLDNLECITRRELMARNTVHNLPPSLKRATHLLGQLKRRIREKAERNAKEQDRRPA